MHQLVAGVHNFQGNVFRTQRDLFERLAQGQSPETLFITCSDSRIDPNLITQTEPGDLFVLRNAGNIVPAFSGTAGGEVATIEFAITGLGVKQIVVCGHSHCGAIKGLLNLDDLEEMPAVRDWLKHAEATRRIVRSKYKDLEPEALAEVAAEENVLTQLENLQTHPAVAVALSQGELSLHAWMYEIETGEVYGYDTTNGQFVPLGDLRAGSKPAPARVLDVRSGDALFRGSRDPA
ncbi:MAG: carbonic anhydrase [Planctomycetota bacterium]|nr:MAG: carbonic anhydrase [Planctomycetota bacterium]